MKREKIINLLVIVTAFIILVLLITTKPRIINYTNNNINDNETYIYTNHNNITVAGPYNITQLEFIPIYSNTTLYNSLNKYKYQLFIFDPTLSGYYNAEILYILIYLLKYNKNVIYVCSFYYNSSGCKYFLENNSINDDFVFLYTMNNNYENLTYILPRNETLLIYLVPTNDSYGIIFNDWNNTVIIYNNNSIIAQMVAQKFILYYYGIINN
jgi:hypothetical protein